VRKILLATLVALLAVTGIAGAQTATQVPIFSQKRLTAAIGVNDQFQKDVASQFTVGPYLAYSLTGNFAGQNWGSSAIGASTEYNVTTKSIKDLTYRVSFRWTIFRGK
jgi:hypothetical protein